jgi:hypothetical protein
LLRETSQVPSLVQDLPYPSLNLCSKRMNLTIQWAMTKCQEKMVIIVLASKTNVKTPPKHLILDL